MPDKLPKGWIRLTMGDVGRWVGGGTPSTANPRYWTGGNIPWVSPKDMKFDLITDAQDHITEDAVAQSATNLVAAGSVLIVVRSGILQHTLPAAVTQRQVALNQDLKAVKPLENIRSDYLAFALKAFERDILHTCTKTGTTVQSLEFPAFLRFPIPVSPLPEQERIVAKLDALLSRVAAGEAAARRALERLKRYRAAVLHAAVTGELTCDWLPGWQGVSCVQALSDMMLDSIFLPFRIPDLYGGIAEIRGILKATKVALVLDFEMKDSFLELFKLDSKVVTIALADIARVELKTGLFRRYVVIAVNRLEAVRQVPGSNAGEVRLRFARKDTATAEEFVSCIQMALTTQGLKKLMNEY